MMSSSREFCWVCLALLVSGCEPSVPDTDVGTSADTGRADGGGLDATTPDATTPDAGAPLVCTDQCRYVREGATGDASGVDWQNAYPAIPDVLTRGGVYFVAGGSYGEQMFDDPESGAQVIRIVRASEASHGTDVGWMTAFGSGPAELGGLTFMTGHYVIDGVTGGGAGSWDTGFGFHVRSGGHNIHFEGAVGNVELRHVDVENDGRYHLNNGNDISVYAIGGAHDLVFAYDYFHDVNGVQFLTRGADTILLEHSMLARNGPVNDMCADGPCHREAWSASTDDRITIRYCVFEDISNTAFIFLGNGTGEAESWQLYGNVFWYSGDLDDVGVSAVIDVDTLRGIVVRGWRFTNNTVAGITGLSASVRAEGTSDAELLVQNNAWVFNTVNAVASSGDADFNFYFGNTRTEGCPTPCDLDVAGDDEPSGERGTTDPFVSSATGDFHLAMPTLPGATLAAPYDRDPDGTLRGADGNWDRGAYERP